MNHKVNNVQGLYSSATDLYNTIVVGGDASADSILTDLHNGIENLKANWKGIDAGKKIEEVIENIGKKYSGECGINLVKVKDMYQLVTNKDYYKY